MKQLKELWNYLNGNKTYIGTVILMAASFMSVVKANYGLTNPNIESTIQTLEWVGLALTSVGFTHKAVKANAKPKGE